MINSLRKDSHITRNTRRLKSYPLEGSVCKNVSQGATVKSSGIIVRKPAEISFSGLSSRTLANSEDLKILINAAKDVFGTEKIKHKDVVKLIKDAVSHLASPIVKDGHAADKIVEPTGHLKSLIDAKKDLIKSIIDKAEELTKTDNLIEIDDPQNPGQKILKMVKDPQDEAKTILEYRRRPDEIKGDALNSITVATKIFPSVNKEVPHWIYINKKVKAALEFADKNNVAFSAAFALLLTCILRPASIMALPGSKKNKDDKKYAAAHSVASGIIGYIISTAVSNPVSSALKKVLEKPQKYMDPTDEEIEKARKAGKILKESKAVYIEASQKASGAAKTWITRNADVLMAVPKGLITIALIPPILKYVFGWEKKNKSAAPARQPISQDFYALNFKSAGLANKKAFQGFMGGTR